MAQRSLPQFSAVVKGLTPAKLLGGGRVLTSFGLVSELAAQAVVLSQHFSTIWAYSWYP